MQIKKLTVANYKSFGLNGNLAGTKVDSLNRINMLFGYNNSGKSNLLKFIELIFQPKISKRDIIVEGERMQTTEEVTFWKGPIVNSPFIFHKNNRDKAIQFEFFIKLSHDEIKSSGFTQYKELSTYFSKTHDFATLILSGEIRKIDDFDTSEMVLLNARLNSKVIYSIDDTGKSVYFEEGIKDNPLKNDGIAFANFLGMFNNCTLFLDNNRYLQTETLNSDNIRLSSQNYKNWLYNLYLNPKRYKLFEDLNAFIKRYKIATKDSGTEDSVFSEVEKNSPFNNFNPEFSVINGNNIEVMFKRGKDRFPLSSFGTGIQQILYILTLLFSTDARIILIEELELNLSPRYQKELFKILWALIEDGKIDQVFFTTHSSYFDHRNDFSVFEISMTPQGTSKVTKANNKTKRSFFFKKLDA